VPQQEVRIKNKLNRIAISSLFVIGLGIVGLVTADIITTLRVPAPGSVMVAAIPSPTSSLQQPARPPQTTTPEVPYPLPAIAQTYNAVKAQTAAAEAIYYTQQAISRATDQAYTPLPTAKAIYLPTGTIESGYAIATGKTLGINAVNGWFGFWDGNEVSLYAGATSDDPDQGVIVILMRYAPEGNLPTPTKHGAVRVVSEQNNRLTLVSTDGTIYYFDIPSLSYVSSLTAFAPSITPPPTRTPYPPNYVTETPYPGPRG
jgi:hypothetical protein